MPQARPLLRVCVYFVANGCVRRLYEEELLLIELAITRLTESIAQETAGQAAEAELREMLAASSVLVQQLHHELQKQQGSCWLLEDERAAAQQSQKEKAIALTAALRAGRIPSEAFATLTKRLHDA